MHYELDKYKNNGKWKPYPKYKDSGVDWIGKIPEHWEVKKSRHLGYIIGSYDIDSNNLNGEGEILYVKVDDLNHLGDKLYLNDSKLKINLTSNFVPIQSNNLLLFPKRGAAIFTNKVRIVKKSVLFDPNIMGWNIFKDTNAKYIAYVLLTRGLKDLADISSVPQINNKHIYPEKFPYPTYIEQNAIVSYIEQGTSKIDSLIIEKERLIQLLQEKRSALINHAVTKGFNPAVNLKDSGIEWIGKIPEHWIVKRLKDVTFINSDVLIENTDSDYELKYIDIGNVDSNGNILDIQEFYFKNAPSRARRKVINNDVIISTVRTYLKAISFISNPHDNLIVSTGFAVLRSKPEIHPKFLWRLVQSKNFVDAVVAHSEGVSYPAINPSKLACLPVWVPPASEQEVIINYIDQETLKIDSLISKIQEAIGKLKEYRTSLISAAVTGKIKIDCDPKNDYI